MSEGIASEHEGLSDATVYCDLNGWAMSQLLGIARERGLESRIGIYSETVTFSSGMSSVYAGVRFTGEQRDDQRILHLRGANSGITHIFTAPISTEEVSAALEAVLEAERELSQKRHSVKSTLALGQNNIN